MTLPRVLSRAPSASLLAVLLLAVPPPSAPASPPSPRCERVVLVIVGGGVRTKELLGRPDLMPTVAAVAKAGFAVPGWAAAGEGHEDAVEGCLTGRRVAREKTARTRPAWPTVLEYARKGMGLPAHDVWYVSYADGDASSLAASGHAEYGEAFAPSVAAGEGPFGEALHDLFAIYGRPNPTTPRTWDLLARLRAATAKEASGGVTGALAADPKEAQRQERALLEEVDRRTSQIGGPNALDARAVRTGIALLRLFRPRLLVVRLTQADVGHANLFAYWDVLFRDDAELARLRAEIADDPALSSTTALVLVPDIGRNATQNAAAGLDHDDASPDARTVAVVGEGPGFRRVTSLKAPLSVCDLCPTLGRLLGFATPYAEGSPRDDLLSAPR